MSHFGFTDSAGNAAAGGDFESFVKALQAAADKQKKASGDDDMALDWDILKRCLYKLWLFVKGKLLFDFSYIWFKGVLQCIPILNKFERLLTNDVCQGS